MLLCYQQEDICTGIDVMICDGRMANISVVDRGVTLLI